MMVVNITKGKLELSDVLSFTKDGSLAMIGAKIEKKPKLIACDTTVIDICSQYSSVNVSKYISLIAKDITICMMVLYTNVITTSTMVKNTGSVPVLLSKLSIHIEIVIENAALTISSTIANNEHSTLRPTRRISLKPKFYHCISVGSGAVYIATLLPST